MARDSTRRLRVVKGAGVTALLLLTLSLAYLGKVACVEGRSGFWAVSDYCGSDVWGLWHSRGFDVDRFPYSDSRPAEGIEPGVLEYPPGVGLVAFVIARLTGSVRAFFDVTAVTFGLAALVTLWQLDVALRALGHPRWRLLGFALSPTVAVVGMQNWDLWSVPFAAAGLAAAAGRRPVAAGVWFGLGAGVKWWPAVLVVLLLVGPWADPDRPTPGGPPADPRTPARRVRLRVYSNGTAGNSGGVGPLRPVLAAVGAWLIVQLPVLLVAPRGWWASISYHLHRPPNGDSTLAGIETLGRHLAPSAFWDLGFPRLATALSLALLAAAVALVAWMLHRGRLAPESAALVLVAAFLATGKVLSPQFLLWLLPVAVVAPVAWTPVLAAEAANLFTWFWIALYYTHQPKVPGLLFASQVSSGVRTAVLVWVAVAACASGRTGPGIRGRRDAPERLAVV